MGYRGVLWESRQGDNTLAPPLGFTPAHWCLPEGASTYLKSPYSCSCRPQDTSRPNLPVWRAAESMTAAPAYFKAVTCRSGFQSAWIWALNVNTPLGTDRSWHILGPIKKQTRLPRQSQGLRHNWELRWSWVIRFISYTKPFLQAWERGILTCYTEQHRQSSKMQKQMNSFQMKERGWTWAKCLSETDASHLPEKKSSNS